MPDEKPTEDIVRAALRQVKDPELSAALLKKVTELNEKAHETKPRSEMSPHPPDVQNLAPGDT